MRKLFVLLPLAAVMALTLTGGASAVAPKNTISLVYSQSTDVGNKKATLSLTGNRTYGPAGSKLVPDIGFHTTIGLPIKVSSKGLYTCSKDEVSEFLSAQAAGRAPKKQCNKAVVGTGSATAYAVSCGSHPPNNAPGVQQITLAITLYADKNGLASYLQATSPPSLSSIKGVFEIGITNTTNGAIFSYGLPQSLLEGVPGLCAPITTFTLTINKTPAKAKGARASAAARKKRVFLKTGPCKTSPQTATYHDDDTDGSLRPDGTLTDTTIDTADATQSVTCRKR
jgi:hypothetical protein